MIIDAHVHIFPPEIIGNRSEFARRDETFALMYLDPAARMVTDRELVAAMDRDGVDVAVVCGFPWHDPGTAATHNDYIIEAAGRFPGRLVPLAALGLTHASARAEAERALAAGAAGLGELGAYTRDLADPAVREPLVGLCGLCAESEKPVLLHTNEPVGHAYPGKSPMSLAGLYDLVKTCDRTRFQLAHLGGGLFFYELLKKEVSQVLKRCVFDTAAAPFLYKPSLYRAFADVAGPDRLLYASDYPLLGLDRYRKHFADHEPDPDFEQKLFAENARAFWNL